MTVHSLICTSSCREEHNVLFEIFTKPIVGYVLRQLSFKTAVSEDITGW